MRGRAAVIVLSIVLACASTTYRYAGRRFDPVRACVEAITTLDTMDGTDPGALCDPVCLVGSPDGADTPIYVSTECPPYPRSYDTSGTSPDCARAIDVFKAGTACPADVGVDAATDALPPPPPDATPDTAPPPPIDSGADAGAG